MAQPFKSGVVSHASGVLRAAMYISDTIHVDTSRQQEQLSGSSLVDVSTVHQKVMCHIEEGKHGLTMIRELWWKQVCVVHLAHKVRPHGLRVHSAFCFSSATLLWNWALQEARVLRGLVSVS